MIINYLTAGGTVGFDSSLSAGAITQLTAVKTFFQNTFVDNISINIVVAFADLTSSGPLGKSTSNYVSGIAYNNPGGTYIDPLTGSPLLLQRLIDDRTSIDDKTAIDNLPATDAHTFIPTRAEAKALGIIASDSASDGAIQFNTQGLFDYTHSGTGGNLANANAYDFYGVAAHEISEIMGRASFIVPGGQFNSYVQPLDLFKRDNTTKALDFDGSKANSFSIDGTNLLLPFNNGTTTSNGFVKPNGDFGDWASAGTPTDDPFLAFASKGHVTNVSSTDLRLLDVIGYDKKATDLVLAIDTTGSMGPYIDNVKANAIRIVNEAFGPASAPNSIDARIGIVGFKDAAGPNGPGENTAILKFTEQNTFDARKTAAVNAINGITVGGGGDIPEGDNSALLFALRDQGLSSTNPLPAGKRGEYQFSGNFRKNADHKIILFSDAPIKDTGLASQVQTASRNLNATVTSVSPGGIGMSSYISDWASDMGMTLTGASDIAYGSSGAVGTFTFDVLDDEGGGDADPGPIVGGAPPRTSMTAQIYVVQAGSDSTATNTLSNLASNNGGLFFNGDASNLADLLLAIIDLPPPTGHTPNDFNGDSLSDILWRNNNGTLADWSMNGANIAASNAVAAAPDASWSIAGIIDFNGDSKADILWRQAGTGILADWSMNGANIAASNTLSTSPDASWTVAGVGDFNGDGNGDILWQQAGTGILADWSMNGANIAASNAVAAAPDSSWSVAGVGDFNGDGRADLLWRQAGTGILADWSMNGANIAASNAVAAAPDSSWSVAGVGDFNGDGNADLLWRQAGSGTLYAWLMNGSTISSSKLISAAPDASWSIVEVADFNGDHSADLLWRQNTTGIVADWTMNGATIVASNTLGATPDSSWQVQAKPTNYG
jgi:FG-GAP-like repeat